MKTQPKPNRIEPLYATCLCGAKLTTAIAVPAECAITGTSAMRTVEFCPACRPGLFANHQVSISCHVQPGAPVMMQMVGTKAALDTVFSPRG